MVGSEMRGRKICRATIWVGALVAALGLATSPATAEVLHDQLAGTAGASDATSDYVTDMPANSYQTADDFEVPSGQSWTITELDVSGRNLSVSRPVNVFIYADTSNGLPGGEVFRQTNINTFVGPNFAIPVTGAPSLVPGSYWISPQVNRLSGEPFWAWDDRQPLNGHPAVQRGASCADWQPRDFCSSDPGYPDEAFRLIGTSAPYPPPPSNRFTLGKPKSKPNGTAVIPATFPGPGSAVVQDARANGRLASVSARKPLVRKLKTAVRTAGTLKLKVKPTRRAKARLNQGRVVKVRTKVTYTPTGGSPNSHVKRIKLKKRLH
jgi:hypothetical protein